MKCARPVSPRMALVGFKKILKGAGKEQSCPPLDNIINLKLGKNGISGNKLNLVRPLKVKQHRRGKRNSLKTFTKSFKWVGNNIAGARSKWASVKRWIRMKNPSILSLQETKFQVAGKHNLDGNVCYEHLRTEKTSGGGIYMAISTYLSPVLVKMVMTK